MELSQVQAIDILNNLLAISQSGNLCYLKILNETVSCEFSYKGAGSYTAKLTMPIMFSIPSGSIINKIKVGNNTTSMFTIILTGDDIITFVNNGTYIVNILEVTIGG